MGRCDDLPVDASKFWGIIATARTPSGPGKPFGQALTGHLATFNEQDILPYHDRFDQLHAALYRWDLWAAAYLIGGGCSDDAFIDFRARIIAQGRGWHEKVTASRITWPIILPLPARPTLPECRSCSMRWPITPHRGRSSA